MLWHSGILSPEILGIPSVHRAAAAIVHAAAGLAAWTRRRGGMAVAVRREPGQLLLQPGGVTLWALGLVVAQNNGLELMTAIGTKVFKNRHLLPAIAHSRGRQLPA